MAKAPAEASSRAKATPPMMRAICRGQRVIRRVGERG